MINIFFSLIEIDKFSSYGIQPFEIVKLPVISFARPVINGSKVIFNCERCNNLIKNH